MAEADGISLGRALWSLGRLQLRDQRLLQEAARRLPSVLPDCGPITLATVWHSFELLRFEDEKCLEHMAREMQRRLADCDPPEVSIVLHAAAQLSFPTRQVLFEGLLEPLRSQRWTQRRCLLKSLFISIRKSLQICDIYADNIIT